MDNNDTHPAPANATASGGATGGPGQALRQARTDLRLSPEDVATQLHLAPRQIIALEADDYSGMPQTTYVRGYLRSYALLLGLSPEPILDAFNRVTAGRAPTRVVVRDRQRPGAEHEGQSKFGALAVGGLILVLVIAWWQGSEPEDALRDQASVPLGTPPAAVPADPAIASSAQTPSATPPVVAAPGVGTAPAAGAPVTTPPVPPVANTAPAPSATIAVTPSEPAPAPTVEPPKPRPLPKNARQARLVLNASAESWVEVRDARGERLLYQTLPAGRIVGLEGMAPFQVFLGNAEGVAVAIDGEAYDASRHRRGTTARFNLSPPAAARPAPAAPAGATPPAPAPDAPTPATSDNPPPPLLPE